MTCLNSYPERASASSRRLSSIREPRGQNRVVALFTDKARPAGAQEPQCQQARLLASALNKPLDVFRCVLTQRTREIVVPMALGAPNAALT